MIAINKTAERDATITMVLVLVGMAWLFESSDSEIVLGSLPPPHAQHASGAANPWAA